VTGGEPDLNAARPAAAANPPWPNPLGTDGFEFVEYTAPDTAELGRLFEVIGIQSDHAASLERRHGAPLGRTSVEAYCSLSADFIG
jgi:hypothetical protein